MWRSTHRNSRCLTTSFLFLSSLLAILISPSNARIVVDMGSIGMSENAQEYANIGGFRSNYRYDITLTSVAYFQRQFVDPNLGRLVLDSEARMFSMDYAFNMEQTMNLNRNHSNDTHSVSYEDRNHNNNNVNMNDPFYYQNNNEMYEDEYEQEYEEETNGQINQQCMYWQGVMLADLQKYSIEQITSVAQNWYTDFVILIVGDDDEDINSKWNKDNFLFWFDHRIPNVPTDYYNMLDKSFNPPYFLAVNRLSGNFLTYVLEDVQEDKSQDWGDCIPYAGVYIDDKSPRSGIEVIASVLCYMMFIALLYCWLNMNNRRNARIRQLQQQNQEDQPPEERFDGTELGQGTITKDDFGDCVVCLEAMPIGTTVRILPCRHAFHHECIDGWFQQHKYTCPMCKLDMCKHLKERREATESMQRLMIPSNTNQSWKNKLRQMLRWRSIHADSNQLLELTDQEIGNDLSLQVCQEVAPIQLSTLSSTSTPPPLSPSPSADDKEQMKTLPTPPGTPQTLSPSSSIEDEESLSTYTTTPLGTPTSPPQGQPPSLSPSSSAEEEETSLSYTTTLEPRTLWPSSSADENDEEQAIV